MWNWIDIEEMTVGARPLVGKEQGPELQNTMLLYIFHSTPCS